MLKPLKFPWSAAKLVGLLLALGPLAPYPAVLANEPQPGAAAYVSPEILPQRLEINLRQRRVTLFQGNQVVKSYPIAIGRPGWETPVGNFSVKQMFKDPPWVHPFKGFVIPGGDPENPLGRHWIGFWTDGKNWVGMHGTPNPESVGRAVSHGCIRMYNRDIAELFTKVTPGTPVIVKR